MSLRSWAAARLWLPFAGASYKAVMNPYEPSPTLNPTIAAATAAHPDWKWMTVMTYFFCALCMLGIPGKANPPGSGVIGFGHGFIPGPALFGTAGFYLAIPILAAIPVALVCVSLRPLYLPTSKSNDMTAHNVLFLLCGLVIAIVNASLYRGD